MNMKLFVEYVIGITKKLHDMSKALDVVRSANFTRLL
jgi:hypothetical protein